MMKKLVPLLALTILLQILTPTAHAEFELNGAANIFIPRYIDDKIIVFSSVKTEDSQITVEFYGKQLSYYLWDIKFDDTIVELVERDDNKKLVFRIKRYVESSIDLRLVVQGQLYCPEYIMRINIPADSDGKVVYEEYIPEYAGVKEDTGIVKVFFRELFSGG